MLAPQIFIRDKVDDKRRGMTKYRVFFATDLHASELCFKKFLSAVKIYSANILILGGDVTGKMIVQIVENEGEWVAKFLGNETRVKSREELLKLETSIRNCGYYP